MCGVPVFVGKLGTCVSIKYNATYGTLEISNDGLFYGSSTGSKSSNYFKHRVVEALIRKLIQCRSKCFVRFPFKFCPFMGTC